MMDGKISLLDYSLGSLATATGTIPDGVGIIKAPDFWSRSSYGENIVIAVIDTGCDITHPNLSDRIIGVRNFTTDDSGQANIVTDKVGHGTHCAGIIAANGIAGGLYGVAPKAKLLILKALSSKGGEYSWVTDAINYAVSQKVNIISMSLGGSTDDPNLFKAVKKAIDNGILLVCAAGNDGDSNSKTTEISYPAAYNQVISVGSVNVNRKASSFTDSNNQIDLVAPGQGLNNKGILSTYPGGKYALMQGTSMAAPHVSGALALLMNWSKVAFQRDLTSIELYSQLIKRTISLGYDKTIEGNGMLYLTIDDIVNKLVTTTTLFN